MIACRTQIYAWKHIIIAEISRSGWVIIAWSPRPKYYLTITWKLVWNMKLHPFLKITIASVATLLILLAFAGTYMLTGVMDAVLENSWLFHLNNIVMGSVWVFVVLKMLRAWEKKGLSDLGIKVKKLDIYLLIASFLISLAFLIGFVAYQGTQTNVVRIRYENFWDVRYLMLFGASCLGWAVAAFKEELLSRGFILYQLRDVNIHKAVAVSAVLFMLIHFPTSGVNPYQAISWWLGGMLYAYAYVKSGSLMVSTCLHAIHNFLNELFIGRSSDFSVVILDHPVADVEKLLYELALKGTLLLLIFLLYNRKNLGFYRRESHGFTYKKPSK